MKSATTLASFVLLCLVLPASAADSERSGLPEGSTGIASRYPGDISLAEDDDVIFVENFGEGELDPLTERWDEVKNRGIMSISTDVPKGRGDASSLLMTHIGEEGTGGHLYRRLPPGLTQVFARFYVKFDRDCAPLHHFGTNLGGFHPPTRWPQGGAGELPSGEKRFTTGVEPYGKHWSWDFYTYWQGMHVHGDGNYWGTPFHSDAKREPVVRDRWICVEMMIRLNDPPTESNGEQAFWIDGKLFRQDGQITSHIGPGFPNGEWTGGWWHPDTASQTTFEGFRWRSIDELTINYLWTYVYITRAEKGHVSKVWFDNIVVARDYIGPLEPLPEESR